MARRKYFSLRKMKLSTLKKMSCQKLRNRNDSLIIEFQKTSVLPSRRKLSPYKRTGRAEIIASEIAKTRKAFEDKCRRN